MLAHIRDYFEKQILNTHGEDVPETRPEQLATAALLIEVMIVDGNLSEKELASISQTLKTLLSLSAEDVEELIALSQAEVDQATSLYEFTRQINQHFDLNQKMHFLK